MKVKFKQTATIFLEILITMGLIVGLIVAIKKVYITYIRLNIAAKNNLIEAEQNEELLCDVAANFD